MLIKRDLYHELINHLNSKEISVIVGPRQVGKTTLMLIIEKYLKQKGKKSLFLNLDRHTDSVYFTSHDRLLNKLKLELGNDNGFVFIDEIQRITNAGLFLKGLYDYYLPYKFIVSGSGSLELKEKIHESLIGRKRIFQLNPVSFKEFVNFKTDYKYSNNLELFFETEKEKTEELLIEYLNFGGYPKVITSETLEEKRIIINEIFTSYIEKDISYLLKVERIEAFVNLIKVLSALSGKLINFTKICSDLNISIQTLKNYLWYAEKTFIIQRISPFFRNKKKEIVKSSCYYFYDIGLKNFAINLFGNLYDYGFVFQNLIFNILKEKLKHTSFSINFWRTKDKAEVDFVVNLGDRIIPFEAKYQNLKKTKIGKSLYNFIKKYSPQTAYIINLNYENEIKISNTLVKFMPYWKLLIDKQSIITIDFE
jgi:predicted AAA+ superfamily ATPase